MTAIGGGWAALAASAVLLGLVVGGAAPHPSSGAVPTVLALYQTPDNITEQSNFSVYLQVTDASNIQQVYFTFCQLTSSLCYLPITMVPAAGNWFVGTTNPMTEYPGMTVGVEAGYNITILYNDNTNTTEPAIPNPFNNLTVAQTVTGEYVYKMVVADHVYGLTGTVTDLATGVGVAGANVTLSPGPARTTRTDAAGVYSFSGVSNGTYTVSVTVGGFRTNNVTVAIDGQSAVQNVQLTNSAAPASPSTGGTGFFSSALGLWLMAFVVGLIVVVAFVAYAMSRRKRGGPPASLDAAAGPAPPAGPE